MTQREREEERLRMSREIDQLIHRQPKQAEETDEDQYGSGKKHQSRIGKLPEINQELLLEEEEPEAKVSGFIIDSEKREQRKQIMNLAGL